MKPCPFCGSDDVAFMVDPWDAEGHVQCRCEARGPGPSPEAEAIAAWNQRHPNIPPELTAALLAAVERHGVEGTMAILQPSRDESDHEDEDMAWMRRAVKRRHELIAGTDDAGRPYWLHQVQTGRADWDLLEQGDGAPPSAPDGAAMVVRDGARVWGWEEP